jgi:hypothetical protein
MSKRWGAEQYKAGDYCSTYSAIPRSLWPVDVKNTIVTGAHLGGLGVLECPDFVQSVIVSQAAVPVALDQKVALTGIRLKATVPPLSSKLLRALRRRGVVGVTRGVRS